ncbi:hypothetical protein FACS189472_07990 [Alphaproteobacteria bacterium]|nr:hypothetical protein FACS189472_07990 [Alphaproteobacteria bacterium]
MFKISHIEGNLVIGHKASLTEDKTNYKIVLNGEELKLDDLKAPIGSGSNVAGGERGGGAAEEDKERLISGKVDRELVSEDGSLQTEIVMNAGPDPFDGRFTMAKSALVSTLRDEDSDTKFVASVEAFVDSGNARVAINASDNAGNNSALTVHPSDVIITSGYVTINGTSWDSVLSRVTTLETAADDGICETGEAFFGRTVYIKGWTGILGGIAERSIHLFFPNSSSRIVAVGGDVTKASSIGIGGAIPLYYDSDQYFFVAKEDNVLKLYAGVYQVNSDVRLWVKYVST